MFSKMKITKSRDRAQQSDKRLKSQPSSSLLRLCRSSLFCVLRKTSITLLIELLLPVYMLFCNKRLVVYAVCWLWLLCWSGPWQARWRPIRPSIIKSLPTPVLNTPHILESVSKTVQIDESVMVWAKYNKGRHMHKKQQRVFRIYDPQL